MGLAIMGPWLLPQALSSPPPTGNACAPTPVKRLKPPNGLDPQWPGGSKGCSGITCFVEEMLVTVNPDGTVRSAVVRGSWGAGSDNRALAAARDSTYVPATVNCKPVEGTYIFHEMFVIDK